jgi:HSP20 family molecular chaperone IbpA
MIGFAETVEVKTSERPGEMKKAILDELKSEFGEWLEAKEDPFWHPPVEVTEKNGEFMVLAPVAGVDLEDVEILVAREMLLVKGELRNDVPRGATIYRSELPHGRLRRSVDFPKPVNPDHVHAEIRNGMLSVNAEIAEGRKFPMLIAA